MDLQPLHFQCPFAALQGLRNFRYLLGYVVFPSNVLSCYKVRKRTEGFLKKTFDSRTNSISMHFEDTLSNNPPAIYSVLLCS